MNAEAAAETSTPVPETTPSPEPKPREAETGTPKPSETDTPKPAVTDTPKPAETDTPKPTATDTPKPAETDTPKPTETDTPKPAETNTPDPAVTDTPKPTETGTPDPAVTDTPKPTETDTPDPTGTNTPEPTGTATPTPEPTATPEGPLFEITDGVVTAWYGRDAYKIIAIPEGVTAIGKDAFRGDAVLEAVILPDSLEEIREKAFADCPRLREVVLSSDSRLRAIGPKAFLNCVKIGREFAEKVESVAPDAFEGVPVITPEPAPTAKGTPTPTPAPTSTPAPTPTPEPTPDPYEDVEWEEMPTAAPAMPAGGGKRQTHGRSRTVMTHDYDQVRVSLEPGQESLPMERLTLEGEELEVTLAGENGTPSRFTISLRETRERAEKDSGGPAGRALILTPEEGDGLQGLRWSMEGTALRKLRKSGIDCLVFRQGERYTAVSTEGFLAGWAYDRLRSRGVAAGSFAYVLVQPENGAEPVWTVTAEGERFEPGEDPLAPMYLTGVETGGPEMFESLEGGMDP